MKMNKVALLIAVATMSSIAQASKWEITTSPLSSATSFTGHNIATAGLPLNPVSFSLGIESSVGYMFMNGVQAVIAPRIALGTAGAFFLNAGFVVGPRINFSFSDKINEDIFVFAGFELNNINIAGGAGVAGTNVVGEVGKRIKLTDSVSWSPSVGVTLGSLSAVSVGLNAKLINFSIFL